jgi:hypothetical protein
MHCNTYPGDNPSGKPTQFALIGVKSYPKTDKNYQPSVPRGFARQGCSSELAIARLCLQKAAPIKQSAVNPALSKQ